jgi:hypothetical protein
MREKNPSEIVLRTGDRQLDGHAALGARYRQIRRTSRSANDDGPRVFSPDYATMVLLEWVQKTEEFRMGWVKGYRS